MENTNEMQLIFDSRSSNESFARVTVAAFMTSLNPTVEEVTVATVDAGRKEKHCTLRLRMKGRGLKMWNRQWNRCLLRNRNRIVQGWDFLSWRHLWIIWK